MKYLSKQLTLKLNPELCVGCGLCRQMCKFGAILDKEGN